MLADRPHQGRPRLQLLLLLVPLLLLLLPP
jgi:hypothetical protein